MNNNQQNLKVTMRGDARHLMGEIDKVGSRAKDSFGNLGDGSFKGVAEEFTNGKTALEGMLGPAGAVAGAIAGISAAAIGTGAALFAMAKRVAESGAEISRFSTLTGFSIETIQALKIASEAAGTSIDEIEEVFESFVELMNEAGTGAEDAAKKVKSLGLDPQAAYKDLEGSFLKVLDKIREMPTQAGKAKVAMDGMGESGLNMIKVAEGMTGGTEAYIKALRESGNIMDQEGIRKTKEFNLQLAKLDLVVQGLVQTVALEYMPEITSAMGDVSKALVDNKQTFTNWGNEISNIMVKVRGAVNWFNSTEGMQFRELFLMGLGLATGNPAGAAIPNVPGGGVEKLGTPRQADRVTAAGLMAEASKETGAIAAAAAEERRKKREEEFKKELGLRQQQNQLFLQLEREKFTSAQKVNEEAFVQGDFTAEEFRHGTLQKLEQYQAKVRELLQNSFNLDKAGKSGTEIENLQIGLKKDLLALDREVAQERADLEKLLTDTIKKEQDKRLDNFVRSTQGQIAYFAANAEKQVAFFRKEFLDGVLTQADLDRLVFQEKISQYDTEIGLLEKIRSQYKSNSLEYLSIETELARVKTRKLNEENDHREKNHEKEMERLKKQREMLESFPVPDPGRADERRGVDSIPGINRGPMGEFLGGADGGEGFFGGIGIEKFNSDAEMMASTMQRLGAIGADSFNQLAGAIGSTVEQWVLYGDASGQSARKAIASALAAASSQAAVSAIMETAYGIAALTPWGALLYGPAALHFKSAALFAAVAAGTGLAGRAIAGDSFKNEGGGGSNEGAPDYQPVRSSNIQNPTQNLLVNQGASARDVQILSQAINDMNSKITGMKPGDVLAAGAKQSPGLIGNAALKDIKTNSTLKADTGKALGMT